MTKLQIEEFQKLEMSYLDAVRDNDPSKQIKMMEVFFFWLKKQMRFGEWRILVSGSESETMEVSEMQKQEFTFLEMAMISAVMDGDRARMVEVELKMIEWINLQLTNAVNKIIRPELKIVRNDKNGHHVL
jgi:hypothetical protein